MLKINDSNITLMVNDMDIAVQFYQNIGLELKQRWENHYAMLTAGNMTIGLHPADGGATGSGSASIGFFIDDIAEVKALLDKHDISYKEDDGKSGHYLNVKDADGNLLYFVKPGW